MYFFRRSSQTTVASPPPPTSPAPAPPISPYATPINHYSSPNRPNFTTGYSNLRYDWSEKQTKQPPAITISESNPSAVMYRAQAPCKYIPPQPITTRDSSMPSAPSSTLAPNQQSHEKHSSMTYCNAYDSMESQSDFTSSVDVDVEDDDTLPTPGFRISDAGYRGAGGKRRHSSVGSMGQWRASGGAERGCGRQGEAGYLVVLDEDDFTLRACEAHDSVDSTRS